MADLKRCVLVYGLDVVEIMKLQQAKVKIVRVTDDMGKMKVKDILEGSSEKIAGENLPKNEKLLVFHNILEVQLDMVMSLTKRALKKKPILATTTETSMEWDFEYLVEHLMEEREWHKTNKGSAMHEQE
ncbi:DUF3783 domain-containing protein [uncultured Clostridium sp.]|jgi:hypothetical protein|uniref:DUF3783 domain-containing protein n=1 Tax=uncultured Clostridium sp. TaxID=59620 RepID=UPI00260449AB|nr:DUF3783 domain-containing protein [uncultured Clostridium sp.]